MAVVRVSSAKIRFTSFNKRKARSVLLTRTCVEQGIETECLPGATAFVPALVNSGFPCDRFCFEGFLPQKKGRQKRMLALADESRTMIFYESPYRLVKALEQMSEIFGPERKACVAREISKKFEDYKRGTLAELQHHFRKHPSSGGYQIYGYFGGGYH